MPGSLPYAVRVRDLLHGYVYLTRAEVAVVNHPLFQRLRHVRQNDVAFYVYPSLNTSRFEHSLGCAHVAGKMAANIIAGSSWPAFRKALGLGRWEFQQVCRLYALLHDVGHLPLSHLFELAFDDYAGAVNKQLTTLCQEWFGRPGYAKLHEACGSALASTLLKEARVSKDIRKPVLELMQNKVLKADDPLRALKQVVDSEIDADRVDATARDGLLAGGEYGTYDIERLCSAVYVEPHSSGWHLAYSHKAIGSIEGLLLDRCRTHTWIHFHHMVVGIKLAVREMLAGLLIKKEITREKFPVGNVREMALRDDVWLWSLLRSAAADSGSVAAAKAAVLLRDKASLTLLWKNRTEYHDWQRKLRERSGKREIQWNLFGRPYERWLTNYLDLGGVKALVFLVSFKPLGRDAIPLVEEGGTKPSGELMDVSKLAGSLQEVWDAEPQYHVVLLGKAKESRLALQRKWLKATSEWLNAS